MWLSGRETCAFAIVALLVKNLHSPPSTRFAKQSSVRYKFDSIDFTNVTDNFAVVDLHSENESYSYCNAL